LLGLFIVLGVIRIRQGLASNKVKCILNRLKTHWEWWFSFSWL